MRGGGAAAAAAAADAAIARTRLYPLAPGRGALSPPVRYGAGAGADRRCRDAPDPGGQSRGLSSARRARWCADRPAGRHDRRGATIANDLVAQMGAAEAADSILPGHVAAADAGEARRTFRRGCSARRGSPCCSSGSSRAVDAAAADGDNRLADIVERMPDAFVLVDRDLTILTANAAFVELTEAASADRVIGAPLATWLGRPGIDLDLIIGQIKRTWRGSQRGDDLARCCRRAGRGRGVGRRRGERRRRMLWLHDPQRRPPPARRARSGARSAALGRAADRTRRADVAEGDRARDRPI